MRAMDLYLGRRDLLPRDGEMVPGYVLAALEPETDNVPVPELLPDSILVSNEWMFERPLRMGEELVANGRLADIVERFGGRFGYSLHFRSETEFHEPSGAVVARSVRTLMYYDARNAPEGADE